MSAISGSGPTHNPFDASRPGSGGYVSIGGTAEPLKSPTIVALTPIAEGREEPMVRGARGPAVRQLQAALGVVGFPPDGGVDAAFGAGTERALMQLQRASGLTATGKLDAASVRAIDARLWPHIEAARARSSGGAGGTAGAGAAAVSGAGSPAAPGRPVIGAGAMPPPEGPALRAGSDTSDGIKATRDLVKYLLRTDGGGSLGGKTIGEVLADAEAGGGGRIDGLLDEAMVDRIPHLTDYSKALLKNHIGRGGAVPYMDRVARDMICDEPTTAVRRAIVGMDRDEVPGARGDGSIRPQEVLDAKRAGKIPADAAERLLQAALHRPGESHGRPILSLSALPTVPATALKNDGGNVHFAPKAAVRPRTIDELSDVLRFAQDGGRQVKPIGSLHSFSRVAVADDIVMLPQGLSFVKGPADLAREGDLKRGLDASRMVRIGSGTQVRTLNKELWDTHGLALPNMGGYDEQTLGGVVSTATHGSGLAFSSFADVVKSMDVVLPGGRQVRMEPTDGITDPAEFRAKHPDMELIQDDTVFHASTAGLGSMGIVHSYVIGVRDKYHLVEKRTETSWEAAKRELLAGGVTRLMSGPGRPEVPGQRYPARHFEILVNPHASNGSHTAIITTRKDAAEPRAAAPFEPNNRNAVYRMHNPEYARPWFGEAIMSVAPNAVGGISRDLIVDVMPKAAPGIIDGAMKSLVDDAYIERSYNVFNIGAANDVDALSSEIAVPIAGDNYVRAMDALMAKAKEFEAKGKFHTGPVSMRFVKGSQALLSPQQGDVAMFEIIFTRGTPHALEMLKAYEEALAPFGARPHLGQVNFTTPEKARARYGDKLDQWHSVRRALDPQGVLRSKFTDEALGTR